LKTRESFDEERTVRIYRSGVISAYAIYKATDAPNRMGIKGSHGVEQQIPYPLVQSASDHIGLV
jgi:hypothetical protein